MKPEFDLKAHVRHVPDFPKPGILFYDISTLLINPRGLARNRGPSEGHNRAL